MLGLGDMNADQLASKLEETLPVIRSVSEQFKDPVSDSSTAQTQTSTLCFGSWQPVTLRSVMTPTRSSSLVSRPHLQMLSLEGL